jgi:MFS family permease
MSLSIQAQLSRSGICAATGSIAGSVVGLLFGLSLLPVPAHTIAFRHAVVIGAVLGIIAWAVVLFLLLAFEKYSPHSILLPSFVTSFLTGILTVFVINAIHQTFLGMILGWIIGFLVGRALCKVCQVRALRAES